MTWTHRKSPPWSGLEGAEGPSREHGIQGTLWQMRRPRGMLVSPLQLPHSTTDPLLPHEDAGMPEKYPPEETAEMPPLEIPPSSLGLPGLGDDTTEARELKLSELGLVVFSLAGTQVNLGAGITKEALRPRLEAHEQQLVSQDPQTWLDLSFKVYQERAQRSLVGSNLRHQAVINYPAGL